MLGPSNEPMKAPARQLPKRQFRRTFIREWRKFRDMTLETLAEKVDMTASHFSMLERGQRGYTQETLEAVADALRTTPGALLNRDPSEEGEQWQAWEQAKPADRRLALDLLKTVKRTDH